jgi:hypothetical protein
MAVISSSAKAGKHHTAVRLLLIVVAAAVLFALVAYYNRNKTAPPERFSAVPPLQPLASPYAAGGSGGNANVPAPSSPPSTAGAFIAAGPSPLEPHGNEKYLPVGQNDPSSYGPSPKDPFPQDKITPDQLLPKDAANTKWAQVNPAGQGDVKDQNFLTAGYHLGFDTQGTSLRNASYDIRSSPPNPRHRVSIWQQSTIDPDLSRRPLE